MKKVLYYACTVFFGCLGLYRISGCYVRNISSGFPQLSAPLSSEQIGWNIERLMEAALLFWLASKCWRYAKKESQKT